MYYAFFIVRRTMYLCILLIMPFLTTTFQIYALILLNFLTLMYYAQVKPISPKLDRRLDIFNEFMVGNITISLFVISDWNTDPTVRFKYGWFIIAQITALIAVNLIFVAYFMFKGLRALYRKCEEFYYSFRTKKVTENKLQK